MSKAILTKLNEMDSVEYLPGFHGKMIHTEKMTFAYWEIDKGAEIHIHNHLHEQVVNMIEGQFELIVEGKPYLLEAGHIHVLPGYTSHGGRAITDCKILDVFSPPREDYQ